MTPPIGSARAGIVSQVGDVIPDSVVYQYDLIANFSQGDSTVKDSGGSSDMSLTGDFQDATIGGESGAEGDGSDDYGQASAATLPTNETWGIAMSISASSVSASDVWFGKSDSGSANRFTLWSGLAGSAGTFELDIADGNSKRLRVRTNKTYDDGKVKAVIINKNGNSASDINIYVDDMSNAAATTTDNNGAYDHTTYNESRDLGFWARNNNGSFGSNLNYTAGVFEFKTSPYTNTERTSFVNRRPEL